MKKIALILAAVMMLSVALVACDPAATDVSDATSAEVSAPADTSKTEESKTEESKTEESKVDDTEESTEEVSEEEVSQAPAVVGDNKAQGKTYTHSGQFRQGGADVGWGWDDNAAISYPDENDKSLTDGVKNPAESKYQDPVWAGFSGAQPGFKERGYTEITVDMGESMALTFATLYVNGNSALHGGDGVLPPAKVEVHVSDDNSTWVKYGEVAPTVAGTNDVEAITVNGEATAKYVQFRIFHTGDKGWVMVSEVEIG